MTFGEKFEKMQYSPLLQLSTKEQCRPEKKILSCQGLIEVKIDNSLPCLDAQINYSDKK